MLWSYIGRVRTRRIPFCTNSSRWGGDILRNSCEYRSIWDLRGGESRNRARRLPSDDDSAHGPRVVRPYSHPDARSCGRPRAAAIQNPVHELAVHVLGGASSGSVGLEIDGGSSVSPPSFRSDTRSGRRGGCHGGSFGARLRRRGVIDRALADLADVSVAGT